MRSVLLACLLLLLAAPVTHADLPSSVKAKLPPGTKSTITSPPLPKDAKSIKVEIKPAASEDAVFFDRLQTILAEKASPKRRLVFCVSLYISESQNSTTDEIDYVEPFDAYAVLLLKACLEMAASIDRAQAGGATAAAARCGVQPLRAPATFTKSGSRYSVAVQGKVKTPRRPSKLKLSCKRAGGGFALRVRARKRGKTLRSVVGPKLLVGLYNPLDADGSPTAKITFKR